MTHTTVDDYVASVPAPLTGVVAVLREMLCAELASAGAIRRGHRAWSVGGAPVAGFRVNAASVTLAFWRGSEIDDPSGRLVVAPNGTASIRVRRVGEIDGALFAEWLRQADDLEYRSALLAG
jgi:hypothetical protein